MTLSLQSAARQTPGGLKASPEDSDHTVTVFTASGRHHLVKAWLQQRPDLLQPRGPATTASISDLLRFAGPALPEGSHLRSLETIATRHVGRRTMHTLTHARGTRVTPGAFPPLLADLQGASPWYELSFSLQMALPDGTLIIAELRALNVRVKRHALPEHQTERRPFGLWLQTDSASPQWQALRAMIPAGTAHRT